MSNDIFDFFGGSSSRKLEPLDESEMFDDLLPAEPAAAEATPVKDDFAKDDVNSGDSGIEPQHADVPAGAISESGFSGSHWDELASSLGLELPTPPAGKRQASPESSTERKKADVRESSSKTRGSRNDRKRDSESRSENRNRPAKDSPKRSRDFEEIEKETRREPAPDTSVARDANETDSSFADQLDDDPFAAFSGVSRKPTKEQPPAELPVQEIPQLEILDEDDIDLIDSDFVEFEVQDLKGARGGDRERRPRRGNRPSHEVESVGEQSRPSPEGEEQKTGEEGRSRRRRGRGRGRGRSGRESGSSATDRPTDRPPEDTRDSDSEWHAENDLLEPEVSRDSEPDQPAAIRRETADRGARPSGRSRSDRDLGRGKRDTENSRSEGADLSDEEIDGDEGEWETGSDKKKVRIPTWDDAIGGLVELNIKRHSSGKSPRGGSRRRRS